MEFRLRKYDILCYFFIVIFCLSFYYTIESKSTEKENDKVLEDNKKKKEIEIEKSIENFDKNNVIPIAIIGAGPAGLTAALYGARAGIHTVVFTGELPGGQLILTEFVENWPGIRKKLGCEIMDDLQNQTQDFGAVLVEQNIEKVDFNVWPFVLHTSDGDIVYAFSVIIATGAAPRKLGIPGELEYWGRGVTACAVCDCHLFKGKDVVVVGGGDSAVEEAMQLAPYAKNIIVLVRSDKMRAAAKIRSKLDEFDNIKIVHNKKVLEVLGNSEIMTGLLIEDTLTGERSKMDVQGLFLAIGQNPNTSLFENQLELNRFGYICVDAKTHETNIPGIYAAGDVEDAEFRQAVVAAAAGCKSVMCTVKWLRSIGLTDRIVKKLSSRYYGKKL